VLAPQAGAKAQLAEAIVAIEQQFEIGLISAEQAEAQMRELQARFGNETVKMDAAKLALFEQAMAQIARQFEIGLISAEQAEQQAKQQAEALGMSVGGGLRFIWKEDVAAGVINPQVDVQDLQYRDLTFFRNVDPAVE